MKCRNIIARIAVSLLFVFTTPAWGAIEFNDAYNFRDFRVNPPHNWTQGPDLLLFGIVITDSDTGQAPAGALVRARNLVSDEEISMRRSGNEFWNILTYTSARADGEWIVEVNSVVGSASALIPAFGTGVGTGQMPAVENLAATTGPQPTFTWDLPSDLLSQNDGNVDRLRARIADSSDSTLIDDRFDPTVSETSYTTPPGIITHNGAYIGQIMVEGLEPFNRSRNFATFIVDDVGVGGESVEIDWIGHARDFRGDNSVGWGSGDRWFVCIETQDFEDTYVHAEQSGLVLLAYPEPDAPWEFCSGGAYDPALSGSWNMTAWNGAVATSVQTHALGDPDQLPLVNNIRIQPNNQTPTIHWDLPEGNSTPFDEIRFGLFDDVTNFRLSRFGPGQDQMFENLPASATSYTFAPGVLEQTGRYVARVVLVDRNDAGNTINRSLTFLNFTPIQQAGGGPVVFLPTLDQGGVYNFDFDVTQAVPVTIDPEVAVGYIYEIGDGDARFASVELPFVGDGLYDLTVFDDAGNLVSTSQLAAQVLFDFTSLDNNGISKFEVSGIEVSAGLDPLDTTAFMTTLTFATSGRFTGSMTPITQEVEEPEVLACDANLDGAVDIRDIRTIGMMRNQPATGEDDPMDWDQNGVINILDARGCQRACTLARCAIQ